MKTILSHYDVEESSEVSWKDYSTFAVVDLSLPVPAHPKMKAGEAGFHYLEALLAQTACEAAKDNKELDHTWRLAV